MFRDPRFIAGILTATGLVGGAVWMYIRSRVTPLEKERRRRVYLHSISRTIEGVITEADANLIHYVYELRGVQYFASQDVSDLPALVPADPAKVIGPASVKYDPRNPANSMVLCEDWSGLPRTTSAKGIIR